MEEMKVNGWTNYPTWLVNLYYGDLFSALIEEGEWNKDNMRDHIDLAERMKEYIEEFFYDETYDKLDHFHNDLIGYGFERINWDEIALCYWEEM